MKQHGKKKLNMKRHSVLQLQNGLRQDIDHCENTHRDSMMLLEPVYNSMVPNI